MAFFTRCFPKLAVILLPLFLTFLLLILLFPFNPASFTPANQGVYNDAIYYWRQILTFSEVGFNGGYYTQNELPARAVWSHFYFYGPPYPAFYGMLGRVFGWYSFTGVLFNLGIATAALGLFVYAVKPGRKQLVALGLVLSSFWPLLLYLPTNMQESLQYVIAIVLAVGFYKLFQAHPVSQRCLWFLALLIWVASLFRFTWSALLIPLFFLTLRRVTVSTALLAALPVALLMASSVAIFAYWSSPFSGSFFAQFARVILSTPLEAVSLLVNQTWGNIINFGTVPGLALALWAQIIAVLVGGAVVIRKPWLTKLKSTEVKFHFLNLSIIALMTLSIYETGNWRDYRILAPHLLLTVLLFIACRRLSLVKIYVLSSLLFAAVFLVTYLVSWRSQFDDNRQNIAAFEQQIENHLVYDAEQPNGWCNTLLVQMAPGEWEFKPELMAVPAGIGISYYFVPDQIALPPKSRYLLLSRVLYPVVREKAHLQWLVSTDIGDLYINLDSGCI